ncbi:MAG: ProQ activator of osmoprotectant transporter prop [Proteobacteria bacterium]|nr:ProQ activator of osmoprotectant transporter prop [Pseudomonadota bacterium]
MSPRNKRDVTDLHRQLMDRFPHAFPKDYDALRPLKLGIHVDILQRWPAVDPVLLRRALANHTRRDGYLLALLHHRGDRRYDLDGQPAGTVTEAERAEAARLLEISTQRGQTKAEQVRTHQAREEKRRKQRAEEQRRREEKARRKAEHERREQEIAARKAALIAQGITPESRSEQKRRLAQRSRSGFRPPAASKPTVDRQPVAPAPAPRPERLPERPGPASAPAMPPVEFRKKRRFVPPHEPGSS